MLNRHVSGASFVALGLGALGGCHEPVDSPDAETAALFQSYGRSDDSLGDGAWRQYLRAPALHRAWAPDPKSPWRPFYRPTLPAAVSIVASAARPVRREDTFTDWQLAELERQASTANAALFIDLPGEDSVAWGARLSLKGLHPVATFNNWPHARGVLKLERPLGALIYYAAEVERGRKEKPNAAGKPVFLLEGTRLQAHRMSLGPDEFDNRYFHVPSDFPSAKPLIDAGVQTVIYVRPATMTAVCEDDLIDYFVGLAASGGKFQQVTVDGRNIKVVPWTPTPRSTIFSPEYSNTYVATSRTYGRSYGHYHHFWSSHQGTWGHRSSGGGGSSFS